MDNKVSVTLVDSMGGDLSVVNSARVSFNKVKSVMETEDDGLIRYLARNRHTTPFRHNSITIRCTAPLFIAAQLKKHQAGLSWNEVSRRYVTEDVAFYKPEEWRERPSTSIKQGSGGKVVDCLQKRADVCYKETVDTAMSNYMELLALGIAPEMARMVLPQCMMTEWYWTGNLLAFAHVYKERIDGHAQLEAQSFASQLSEVIKPLFPVAWGALTGEV